MSSILVSVTAAILCLSVAVQAQSSTILHCPPKQCGTCAYFGEPHLRPFPEFALQPFSQYLCQPKGPEILVRNNHLEIVVSTRPWGGHPIISYSVTFLGPNPCTITDHIDSPANPSSLGCPDNTAGVTLSSLNGGAVHHFHSTQRIQVDIQKQWSHFDITVTQTHGLISQSTGVCKKSNCRLEFSNSGRRRRATATDAQLSPLESAANKICDTFIAVARKQVSGPVDERLVEMSRVACVYDVNATSDQSYAQTAAAFVLQASLRQAEVMPNLAQNLMKVDGAAQSAIREAARQTNQFISASPAMCSDAAKGQCLRPIENLG